MIEMSDIFNFIDQFIPQSNVKNDERDDSTKEETSRRPFIMGSNLVKSNHVFEMRIKKSESKYHAFCLCLPGSNPLGTPHKIVIDITQTVSILFKITNHVGNLGSYVFFYFSFLCRIVK